MNILVYAFLGIVALVGICSIADALFNCGCGVPPQMTKVPMPLCKPPAPPKSVIVPTSAEHRPFPSYEKEALPLPRLCTQCGAPLHGSKCKYCDTEFEKDNSTDDCEVATATLYMDGKPAHSTSRYTCSICGSDFDTWEEHRVHSNMHDSEDDFQVLAERLIELGKECGVSFRKDGD